MICLCIYKEHSIQNTFRLFCLMLESLLLIVLSFVRAFNILGMSLFSCLADQFFVEVNSVKSSKSNCRNPWDVLIPSINAEEIDSWSVLPLL